MALMKCPRCELNYIQEKDKVCEVCKRAIRGEEEREEVSDICPECGENTVVQGEELCVFCLRERKRQENLEKMADQAALPDEDIALSNVAEIEEIDVPMQNDIPPSELQVIDKELGIEGKEILLGDEPADEMDDEFDSELDSELDADLSGDLLDDDFDDDDDDDDDEEDDED